MKKWIYILSCFVLGLAVGIGYLYLNKPNVSIAEAKLEDNFTSLDDMDVKTGIIVIGEKVDQKSYIQKDDQNLPDYYFTLSNFKVEQVIKNSTKKTINSNDIVNVLETAAYDSEQDQLLSVAGYMPMESNKRYILFLSENLSEEGPAMGSYNIQGVFYGKFPMEKNPQIRSNLLEIETSALSDKEIEKYNEMARQIEERYKTFIN